MILALNNEKSIAVLPFENLSSDPENEYFSDGMTEEIINALSQIEHLKVTARTSSFAFKNRKLDIRTIGKELGVSLVLEGSVRKSKGRLRITAQLIRALDGFHIWSQNFDRSLQDVFDLQDEISLLIADKIREQCGHLSVKDQLFAINTNNVEAYQCYLKGRFHYHKWDMPGFAEAAKEFKKSLMADPGFDLPYFGTGLSYSFLGSWGTMDREAAFSLAEDYFARGKRLGTQSPYSFYSLAKHQFWGLWNYREAYQTLSKAYAAQPHDADVNEFMAEIHTLAGNFSAALKYSTTSLQIDPLAPNHYYTKANIFYLQGRFPEALITVEKGLSIAPDFTISREVRLICFMLLGQSETLKKDVAAYESPVRKVFTVLNNLIRERTTLGITEVNELISNLRQVDQQPLLAWDLYLMVHSGNLHEALKLLLKKTTERSGQVINFKYDPLLKPLRKLDGYHRLVSSYFQGNPLSDISGKTRRVDAPLTVEEAKHFADLLLSGMQKEKYYLDVNLGLKDLAAKINLHPNKLSWLLNDRIGKNFYEFVNGFRLKEFQEKAVAPQNQHLSLLGLAYDSGFNSKSVFNDYFKKSTGLTPGAWLKQQQKP